ncbi:MAG: class I SAM-dependent methyltransferase [Alphaproteobacteria bacterium]|nr:class I SAM-dependent methyltransferase [Alphaproteobacteria bacterium]
MSDWNKKSFRGTWNRYPFSDVVSFVMRRFGRTEDRSSVAILDLGCGGGSHLMFLAQEGFDFHGIDGNAESVERANERLRSAGHDDRRAVTGTFDRLPYPSDRFDAVIDRGSLTCNSLADLPPLIAEIRRVLKPGGTVFSMILHELGAASAGGRHVGSNDYVDFPGDLSGSGLLHFTTAEEARGLFSAFRDVGIDQLVRSTELPRREPSINEAWTIVTATK